VLKHGRSAAVQSLRVCILRTFLHLIFLLAPAAPCAGGNFLHALDYGAIAGCYQREQRLGVTPKFRVSPGLPARLPGMRYRTLPCFYLPAGLRLLPACPGSDALRQAAQAHF